jgi:acetolactate synthase-1/2/3 large subunit
LRRDDLHRRALRRPYHRPADAFSPNSKKIHIDIDPSSINKNVRVDLPIIGDVGIVLERHGALWRAGQADKPRHYRMVEADRQMARARLPRLQDEQRRDHAAVRDPAAVRATKDMDTYITTEVGQHQMWAAQHFGFESRTAG